MANAFKFLQWFWIKLLFYSAIVIYLIGAYLIFNGFYLLFTKQKTLAETILILAGAITTISVVYLAEQIRVSSEQEKVKRSCDYFTRYNSESFKDIITEAISFLRDSGKSKDLRLDMISNRKNQNYKKTRFVLTTYFN